MAEANDEGDDLTEIIVNAPDGGGYGSSGGGGGGFVGDLWANWVDNFIWAGFYNGPNESGGGDPPPEEDPEIVVNAPPPQPNNTLENSLAVITDLLTFDNIDDYIGLYRLRLTPGENGRIELDLVDEENGEIDTYVITQSGGLEFSTPFENVTAFPDQPWEYTGPSQEPFPTDGHHWL